MAEPLRYAPQLASVSETLPAGGDWVFEPKLDGYRIGALCRSGKVTLISRGGKDWSEKFPRLREDLGRLLPDRTVVDGEVVALDPKGRPSFQLLQNAMRGGDAATRLHYHVFDLLVLNGRNLRNLPLEERRRALAGIFGREQKRIHLVSQSKGAGNAALTKAIAQGHEGVIAKRLSAHYMAGRTSDWLKVKQVQHEEFVIIGISPHTKIREAIGSLLLGLAAGPGEWLYCGKVGTGFSDEMRGSLWKRFAGGRGRPEQVLNPEQLPRGARLIAPRAACEVAFTEWTADGIVRHPSYLGIREDKSPSEIGVMSSSHPFAVSLRQQKGRDKARAPLEIKHSRRRLRVARRSN